ncbi:MAG: histidine phosphotransferase family protein [Marivibrio sp.]|uniref:histidine phosphotransferase family protein n=1 Tax=Marivibrio sp. TaxID=2039719 RepID=UPI0032EB14EE
MPNAVDHALRISELVAARFAHELVGAAGAIANGLELMEELGEDAGPDAAQLVNRSAGNLKARLQFYRMAYGRAGRESAGLPELRALTVGFFDHVDGVTLDWPMAPVVPTLEGGEGKLILNLAALAADALPRGGTVRIALDDERFEARASGQDARLRDDLAAALTAEAAAEELSPRTVHAHLTAVLAADAGRRLTLERLDENALALCAVR